MKWSLAESQNRDVEVGGLRTERCLWCSVLEAEAALFGWKRKRKRTFENHPEAEALVKKKLEAEAEAI